MPTPKPSKLARIRALVASRQQFTARSETERDYCYIVASTLGITITSVPAWKVNGQKSKGHFEICPVFSEKEIRLKALTNRIASVLSR